MMFPNVLTVTLEHKQNKFNNLLYVIMSSRSMQRVGRLLFSHGQKRMLMKYHSH